MDMLGNLKGAVLAAVLVGIPLSLIDTTPVGAQGHAPAQVHSVKLTVLSTMLVGGAQGIGE